MACRFLPWTPSPATTTLNRRRPSLGADPLVARAALHHVDLVQHVACGDRQIPLDLALVGRGERAEDRGDHIRAVRDHRERRIGQERIAGADSVDDAHGEWAYE